MRKVVIIFFLAVFLSALCPAAGAYEDTAAYGHFGRDGFPWEKTDKVESLKEYFA